MSEKQLPTSPFIVYFMHYQPERSSLPEGLDFAQQWFAIRLLSWFLPQGWTLLVREHPTTWLMPIDVRVRTMNLYKDISSLENTRLCSMDIDTFELIDKSEAISTLTGKVGIQAILRGKPVIAFGLPSYKDHPACFSVRASEDLNKAITAIHNGLPSEFFNEDSRMKYFSWVERNSISADPEETNWKEARLKNFSAIYRKILCGDLTILNSRATFKISAINEKVPKVHEVSN